jgi:hypothetical protein
MAVFYQNLFEIQQQYVEINNITNNKESRGTAKKAQTGERKLQRYLTTLFNQYQATPKGKGTKKPVVKNTMPVHERLSLKTVDRHSHSKRASRTRDDRNTPLKKEAVDADETLQTVEMENQGNLQQEFAGIIIDDDEPLVMNQSLFQQYNTSLK